MVNFHENYVVATLKVFEDMLYIGVLPNMW